MKIFFVDGKKMNSEMKGRREEGGVIFLFRLLFYIKAITLCYTIS